MTADLTFTANFAIDASRSPTRPAPAAHHRRHPADAGLRATTAAVRPSPATGYHFVDWSDGLTTAGRTDTDVTAHLTVTANFAVDTTFVARANGGADGATSANCGVPPPVLRPMTSCSLWCRPVSTAGACLCPPHRVDGRSSLQGAFLHLLGRGPHKLLLLCALLSRGGLIRAGELFLVFLAAR